MYEAEELSLLKEQHVLAVVSVTVVVFCLCEKVSFYLGK